MDEIEEREIILLKILNNKGTGQHQHISAECRRCEFDPWVRKIPWRRTWQPTPVFLSGKFQGQRSLVGYCHDVANSRT